ncbi:MAG TPA: DUF3618 domain-containing protein [Solirubrobacteraceae bacterium]|nr:DUF3618 domain-containing protein [Solirubrobacteraceae bacterium]
MAQRTPEEIRDSIDRQRGELVTSVERLRGEVERLTDWRYQVERHQPQIVAGAAVLGTLLVARSLMRRRRRRRRGY